MDGLPQGAQIITYTDALAGILKASYAFMGTNAPGESGTLAALAASKKAAILGDGATSYGLGAPAWQSSVAGSLASLAARCRYDLFFSTQMQGLMSQLDTLIKSNMPQGWTFATTSAQAHPIDFWLTRINAVSPATPATPTLNGTLAAANFAGGALPNVSAGQALRVVFTLVGALDYSESLPSPECTQIALTGAQNGYSMTLPGSVPTGIYKVRIYRTLVGGASGVYYFDQDVAVTPGSAFPTVSITRSDASLRQDIQPPQWMSGMLTPECAALFALAFASSSVATNPLGFGAGASTAPASLLFGAQNMLSPINVLAGPSNGFVGIGNTPGSAQFGNSALTGSNAQTYTAGAIQAANVAPSNIQGYAGATGIRARVTNALDAAATVSISYTYLAASTGQIVQTGTISATFPTAVQGSVVTFSVPAGRLVQSATVTGISGGATTGAFVLEPSIRSY